MLDRAIEFVVDTVDRFKENTGFKKIGFGILILLFAVLALVFLATGLGLVGAIVMTVLIGMIIYFGSLTDLARSVVIVAILKIFAEQISEFATIWTSMPEVQQTVMFFANHGLIEGIAVVLLPAVILRHLTSGISLINVKNSTTIKEDKEKKDTQENED